LNYVVPSPFLPPLFSLRISFPIFLGVHERVSRAALFSFSTPPCWEGLKGLLRPLLPPCKFLFLSPPSTYPSPSPPYVALMLETFIPRSEEVHPDAPHPARALPPFTSPVPPHAVVSSCWSSCLFPSPLNPRPRHVLVLIRCPPFPPPPPPPPPPSKFTVFHGRKGHVWSRRACRSPPSFSFPTPFFHSATSLSSAEGCFFFAGA